MKLEQVRLQKLLAEAGFGSRRELEKLIEAGRIEVNGKVAELGMKVTARARIRIDGRAVTIESEAKEPRFLLYHKPAGEICTRKDPEGRPTIFNNLPRIKEGRWISVGRLDVNTSGLIIFTNDGGIANKLMHPSHHIEREYAVRLSRKASQETLKNLVGGVKLEDGMARFEDITEAGGGGTNQWYYVTVMEGRNRIVRRLWESQNMIVNRLMRVRFGPIFLEKSLRPGKYIELTGKDKQKLIELTSDDTSG